MTKVITYGTFDLFHQGHYNLLKRAKELGDYLIVGVTTEHFDEARGKVNVIDSTLKRVENVQKTGFADEIIIEDHEGQKIEDIQKYGVDIFTVGSDWVGTFDYLNAFCKVVYLERTPNVSSTMKRSDRFQIVRIGIVGTGRIAPRFIAESKYVSGLSIVCAYNPEQDSAKRFEKRQGIPVYMKDYSKFLDQVDAVYIASPNETHYDYTKKALQAGKHVLCEKPMAFTKKQTIELYQLAKEKKVVLLEGIKAAYCPGFQQLINVARSGRIGEICDVEACFTRLADIHSRERTDAAYGGAFLEFGGYALLPIIKLLGKDYKEVRIDSIPGEDGIDLYTKVQLIYPHGMATAKTGVGVKSEGQLVVAGTKGYILAESPWWLTKKFVVRYEDSSKIENYEPRFQGDGLRYEINEFVSNINGYSKNGYKLTAEESIVMAEITEKFMEKRKENQSR
ncbi:MAG: Gfo/Idh/MocA family oxidoreductase [Agathobacter sp.]|nr:Gfo/Idh/MocA family oxidoreductase [Agathobacter sp.]